MRGLALSGGGFRATLFHVGSLWRLNELGLLSKMDEITSVSGGSILAAHLGLHWSDLNFNDHDIADNYRQVVADPIMEFCSHTTDVGVIMGRFLWPFIRPTERLVGQYRKRLYGNMTLQDLPEPGAGPRFTIYATSMQTGASVRFSRERLGEYHLGEIKNPRVPLAVAVAASSGFPPVLCPVKLKLNPDDWKSCVGADLFDDNDLKSMMYLADGGVYDNLGLEHLRDCDTIFVSDAGAPVGTMSHSRLATQSMIMRTKRTLDIMGNQIRGLRLRKLIGEYKSGERKGAFWGINTKIDSFGLNGEDASPALASDNEITSSLGGMRTRLNCFSPTEQGRLINWGYALTDAALRSHDDSDLPASTTGLPIPDFAL